MSNLDDFIIHSQYPVEKIVWTAEGVKDNTNPNWHDTSLGGYVFEPIPDTLQWDSVLVDGVWTNDDWQTSIQLGANSVVRGYTEYGGSYTLDYDWLSASVFPKGLDFFGYVLPSNCVNVSGGSMSNTRTLKYKIWAFVLESDWASTSTDKTAQILAYSLQKDTRLAQLNMISENLVQVPNHTTKVLYHNLGFRPFCKMWSRSITNGVVGNWTNELWTLDTTQAEYRMIRNTIFIDSEKITITADDYNDPDVQSERYDFLIRIYNYAIPE